MKQFKFRLESVLQVKTRREEIRQRELSTAERLREQAQQQLAEWQEQIAETMRFYREQLRKSFDPRIAGDYYAYLNWLNRERTAAAALLRQREAEVAAAQARLVEASRERRMIEQLKEKALREYQFAELQAEINFLDELGTGRFVRSAGLAQEGQR